MKKNQSSGVYLSMYFNRFMLLALSASGLMGCDSGDSESNVAKATASTEYTFMGYVYRCDSGARVENYTIRLKDRLTEIIGEVTDGYYSLGPLVSSFGELSDFTVSIESPGYLPFESFNESRGVLSDGISDEEGAGSDVFSRGRLTKTEQWTAYLCPESLLVDEEVSIELYRDDQNFRQVQGQITLIPTEEAPAVSYQSRFGEDAEENGRNVGDVPLQTWRNDAIRREGTVTAQLNANGVATIPAGQLIRGMDYDLVALIDNAQYLVAEGAIRAGVQNVVRLQVSEFEETALAAVYRSDLDEPNRARPNAELRVSFNQPVELVPDFDEDDALVLLNQNLGIETEGPELNDGDDRNHVLKDFEINEIDLLGVTFSFEDNNQTLLIQWNPAIGLEDFDLNEPFNSEVRLEAKFCGLDGFMLQPQGENNDSASLVSLLLDLNDSGISDNSCATVLVSEGQNGTRPR